MLKHLTVEELLCLMRQRYDLEMDKANREIQELSAYKAFVEANITDKNLLQNYLGLKKENEELLKEVMSWRENGTPF